MSNQLATRATKVQRDLKKLIEIRRGNLKKKYQYCVCTILGDHDSAAALRHYTLRHKAGVQVSLPTHTQQTPHKGTTTPTPHTTQVCECRYKREGTSPCNGQ